MQLLSDRTAHLLGLLELAVRIHRARDIEQENELKRLTNANILGRGNGKEGRNLALAGGWQERAAKLSLNGNRVLSEELRGIVRNECGRMSTRLAGGGDSA